MSKLTRELAAPISEIQSDVLTAGRGENVREIKRTKFKLASKLTALELLARYHKLVGSDREGGGDTNVGLAITVQHVGESNEDEAAPVAPMPSDETERGPAQDCGANSAVTPSGQAQNSLQPSSFTVPLPPASQSKGFTIMPPEPPRRRFLTRTGAAMAFLRGGGSR